MKPRSRRGAPAGSGGKHAAAESGEDRAVTRSRGDRAITGSGGRAAGDEPMERACRIADAVLYDGRPFPAPGRRPRWRVGVLVPPGYTAAGEPSSSVTECLLEAGPDAEIRVRLRFLHLRTLTVWRAEGTAFQPVPRLTVNGIAYRTRDDAVPCETEVVLCLADLLDAERTIAVGVPGEWSAETIEEPGGQLCGRVIVERLALRAALRARAEHLPGPHGLMRLRVSVANTHGWSHVAAPREQALRRSLLGTHLVIEVCGGAFLSSVTPPEWAREAAERCRSAHAWPVLAGAPGDRTVLLSSPIILCDHPVPPDGPRVTPLDDRGDSPTDDRPTLPGGRP